MSNNTSHIKKSRKSYKGVIIVFFLLICLTIATFVMVLKLDHQKIFNPDTSLDTRNRYHNTVSYSTKKSKESSLAKNWSLTLVNKWNPIQDNKSIDLVELSNGECVDKRIYPDLQKMFDAARNDGINPVVVSGYRTRQKQMSLYNNEISSYQSQGMTMEEAKIEASYWVAPPDASEHQLGLAVDINADGVNSENNDVYDWLKTHAHYYGFILRYPPNKTELTGVAHEPWHYRYVGKQVATEIYEKGICLEEYLDITR